MTKDELIAKQSAEIEELKTLVADYRAARVAINNMIYSIGGPLNDNSKGYTKYQMKDFSWISDKLFSVGREE